MSDLNPAAPPPLLETVSVAHDIRLPRRSLIGRAQRLRTLHGVSLVVDAGFSLGIVGEPNTSTLMLARIVLGLDRPDFGTVRLGGEDLFAASRRRRRVMRRRMQMLFRDPHDSLDPRLPVGRSVGEALAGSGARDRRERVAAELVRVGLDAGDAARTPREFTGGQLQRIAIARALVTNPAIIVADDPAAALDISVRAQILNLLIDLREREAVSFLLISDDLALVNHLTDRTAVMYYGRIVEEGPTADLLARPRHPYTAALVAAVPRPDPARRNRPRERPSEPVAPWKVRHCPFAAQCPRVRERCRSEMPPLEDTGSRRRLACFYPLD